MTESKAIILDGRALGKAIRAEVRDAVELRLSQGLPRPGLATLLVGEDAASKVYVRSKQRASEKAGIASFGYEFEAGVTQETLLAKIDELNADSDVHGILVQLPLPAQLDEAQILERISIYKDVDGLHPHNIGLLAQKSRQALFESATPQGIMHLLRQSDVNLEGANAVVLGRSNIVGRPLALMLLKANATVTIAHSRSRDLPGLCRQADVLVAAVGQPEMLRGDWIKPGAVVIDVGVNRVEDAAAEKGYRLVGDVAFDEALQKAGFITPVPGGVGPLTIAMLLKNTLRAAKLSDPS